MIACVSIYTWRVSLCKGRKCAHIYTLLIPNTANVCELQYAAKSVAQPFLQWSTCYHLARFNINLHLHIKFQVRSFRQKNKVVAFLLWPEHVPTTILIFWTHTGPVKYNCFSAIFGLRPIFGIKKSWLEHVPVCTVDYKFCPKLTYKIYYSGGKFLGLFRSYFLGLGQMIRSREAMAWPSNSNYF